MLVLRVEDSYPEIGQVRTLDRNDIRAESRQQRSRSRQGNDTAQLEDLDACQRTLVFDFRGEQDRLEGRSAWSLLVIYNRVASHGLAHRRFSPMLRSVTSLSGEPMLHVLQLEVSGRVFGDLRFDDLVSIASRFCWGFWIDAVGFQEAGWVEVAHNPVMGSVSVHTRTMCYIAYWYQTPLSLVG
jgi:hypothetical protein